MTWLFAIYAAYCLACVWARFVSRKQERAVALRRIFSGLAGELMAESILSRAFHDAIVPQTLYRSEQPMSVWGISLSIYNDGKPIVR